MTCVDMDSTGRRGDADADLLRRARRDPGAFRAVYGRYVARVFSLIRSEVRDPEVAMDLTAETFARALAGVRRFRARRADGSAGPWLFGIARNVVHEYRREGRAAQRACERLGIERWSYDVDALERVDERLDLARISPALRTALATLAPGQRSAVELRVVEERSYGEVAQRLGCTPLAARIRVSRAMRVLNSQLQGVDR